MEYNEARRTGGGSDESSSGSPIGAAELAFAAPSAPAHKCNIKRAQKKEMCGAKQKQLKANKFRTKFA